MLLLAVPSFTPQPMMRLQTPQVARVPELARACDTQMVSTLGCVAAAPALYALMSINEYITHRWYQHEEFNKSGPLQRLAAFFLRRDPSKQIKIYGGGHVQHHAETYDDMTLKKDPRWRRSPAALSLDSDKWRGTAFTWQVTGLMTIQMLPSTLPVFALLGFNLLQTFAVLMPGMLLHALVWNMLHPPMHGLPDVPFRVGAPSSWLAPLRNTKYFKYIYENHMGHHVLGGQCNVRSAAWLPLGALSACRLARILSPLPQHRGTVLCATHGSIEPMLHRKELLPLTSCSPAVPSDAV